MSAHTQGPWIADNNEGYSPWSIWSRMTPSGHGTPGPKLADVYGDSAESDANARLIAATPELLEAVNAVYTNAVKVPDLSDEFSINRATLNKIKAALAKATGASNV